MTTRNMVALSLNTPISQVDLELMRGSRVVVSFDGTWWDTLSREEQLEYIKKHKNTMKKAKPAEAVKDAGKKVADAGKAIGGALKAISSSMATTGKSTATKLMKSLQPDQKANLQNAVVKVDVQKPDTLTDPERKVFKKIGMGTIVEMLLVAGAAIALGPVMAPVIASMYLSWKLDGNGLGDVRGYPMRGAYLDPEDYTLLDNKQKKKIKQAQLDYSEPEETAEDQKAKVEEADDKAKKKAEGAKTVDVDAKEIKPDNRQPLTNEGDDNAPKDWPAGTKSWRDDTKSVKTEAEPVADKDRKKKPKRFANKAPKELTESEMGDAIVADFQEWLQSAGPEEVVEKAKVQRKKRQADLKSAGAKKAPAKKAPAKKTAVKKAAPAKKSPAKKAAVAVKGKKARAVVEPVEQKDRAAKPTKKKAAKPIPK